MEKRSFVRGVGIGILIVLGFVVFFSAGGLLVQSLWNWLVPELFGLPAVTFWQALGLLVLTRILFGGFGAPGRPGKGRRGNRGPGKPPWLSPEEREHLERAADSQPDQAHTS